MLRDRGTLRFALLIPAFQLVLFGSIDTTVRDVPTAVLDLSRTRESRELVDALVATSYFRIVERPTGHAALHETIVAGRAKVAIEIPPDFARARLAGRSASFLVLIDGSDNSIASQSLAAVDGLALSRSLRELLAATGQRAPPLDPRPRILFNPDMRSAALLIPGLIAILLSFSGTLLSAYAIVRERERGTLEQLMVTPVSAIGLTLGKLLPYLVLAFIQLGIVLALMVFAFRVPIHGSVGLLAALSLVYLLALLSVGLLISAKARTQMEATQMAQMVLLPSILLSGYIFPLSSLPTVLRWISQILPATHFIEITRGIVIRGTGLHDLWGQVLALLAISAVLLAASTLAFQRTMR